MLERRGEQILNVTTPLGNTKDAEKIETTISESIKNQCQHISELETTINLIISVLFEREPIKELNSCIQVDTEIQQPLNYILIENNKRLQKQIKSLYELKMNLESALGSIHLK